MATTVVEVDFVQAPAAELPLNDERKETKKNRHVVIALNHLNKRLEALVIRATDLRVEIDEIHEAIAALE